MSLRQRTGDATPAQPFTSADLLIDDDLPALDRVCEYTCASVALMRLVHVSMLSDVAHDVGFEVMVGRIFPLLPKLCDDPEFIVRNKVAPEIATMCQLCIAFGAGKGYDIVVTQLLPLLAKLAGDVHADVRASGAKALAMISIMLKPEDLAVHLFTIVIELANAEGQDEAEDLRMAAAELMELLAPHLRTKVSVSAKLLRNIFPVLFRRVSPKSTTIVFYQYFLHYQMMKCGSSENHVPTASWTSPKRCLRKTA